MAVVGVGAILAMVVSIGAGASQPSFVQIASGHIGRYQWAAAIERPESKEEAAESAVCLALAFSEPPPSRGGISNVSQCGPLSQSAAITESIGGGHEGKRRMALAMLFDGRVRRLYLKVAGQTGRSIKLLRVSASQLGSIRSESVSYFAHGYAGNVCVERFIAYSSKGSVLQDSGRQSCAR